MTDTKIYRDISERCKGNVYIGVVGPVRSGKSTFIKKFMESVVIPCLSSDFECDRARDELPQSAGGRTVMTTEPKFIPDEGVMIKTSDGVGVKVKLIDCVGYMIPEALGVVEDGKGRLVNTPWHENPVPFEEAAEYGTRKVISEHSTVGMLVTSDGTVGDFPRDNYVGAEERVAAELAECGKPFAIILNSSRPESESAVELALKLEEKYNAPVALVNCLEINAEDIRHILEMVIEEFPAKEADIVLPAWTKVLPEEHKLKKAIRESVLSSVADLKRLRDIGGKFRESLSEGMTRAVSAYGKYGDEVKITLEGSVAGDGKGELSVKLPEELYFDVISEITSIPMKNQTELLDAIKSLSAAKKELDKYQSAIDDVNAKGYGIVLPDESSLKLEEPELVRQSGGYGVRLKASASSIHMIKTSIKTELSPMIGTQAQSEEMVETLKLSYENDPAGVWASNMFGRSLGELVNDGLLTKLSHLPDDARLKFGETISKVINDESQGVICIIL